jgi:glycosyltransferase involved in cell wall biosynthesis
MNFSGLRIGFVPFSRSAQHPFDSRNFLYYANKRDVKFEIVEPGREYDIIVLTPQADLTVWSRYAESKAKIIYMSVDSYLSVPRFDIKGALRGLAKYVSREHKYLRMNYSRAIKDMCGRADAVVCTTLEQKRDILGYCKNVHIILDCHFKAVRDVKTDYSIGTPVNLVWEGLPDNMPGLAQLNEVLAQLRKKHPISLHIITDLEHKKYMNKIWTKSTVQEARSLFGDVHHLFNIDSPVCLYQWNIGMFSRIVTNCDLAVIPLDPQSPLALGKPENKLVLFWRMGMPTIVTASPAYVRAMEKCGLDLYCRDRADWQDKLERLIVDYAARKTAGTLGKQCADSVYGEEVYLEQWDRLFQSVLD